MHWNFGHEKILPGKKSYLFNNNISISQSIYLVNFYDRVLHFRSSFLPSYSHTKHQIRHLRCCELVSELHFSQPLFIRVSACKKRASSTVTRHPICSPIQVITTAPPNLRPSPALCSRTWWTRCCSMRSLRPRCSANGPPPSARWRGRTARRLRKRKRTRGLHLWTDLQVRCCCWYICSVWMSRLSQILALGWQELNLMCFSAVACSPEGVVICVTLAFLTAWTSLWSLMWTLTEDLYLPDFMLIGSVLIKWTQRVQTTLHSRSLGWIQSSQNPSHWVKKNCLAGL